MASRQEMAEDEEWKICRWERHQGRDLCFVRRVCDDEQLICMLSRNYGLPSRASHAEFVQSATENSV
jgi:hypothetical protein